MVAMFLGFCYTLCTVKEIYLLPSPFFMQSKFLEDDSCLAFCSHKVDASVRCLLNIFLSCLFFSNLCAKSRIYLLLRCLCCPYHLYYKCIF
jgi:hypothetical protein